MKASIGEAPTVDVENGTTTLSGAVSYYVEDKDQANALMSLKDSNNNSLFNVTRVGNTDKWYVELAGENTNVDDIIKAFNNDTFLAEFTKQTYTSDGGGAVLTGVTQGYYFIKSSLGT